MSEHTFFVICDFYPQGFLLRLRTEPYTLTANDIYKQVRSRIIASGDVAPPASQLRLGIIQETPGDEHDGNDGNDGKRLLETMIPDEYVTHRGLGAILASFEVADECSPPTLKVYKHPSKARFGREHIRSMLTDLARKSQ